MKMLWNFTPAILGAMVVLQAGLNKRIADRFGLPAAALLNCIVVCVCAAAIYAVYGKNQIPDSPNRQISWWFLLPGLMGICLIFGGPLAVKRFGAAHTFVVVVSAQLLVSLLWDYQMEGIYPTGNKIVGAALAWVGAILVVRS